MESGLNFQITVQADFLNKKKEIYFRELKISERQKMYCYDCSTVLPYFEECMEKSKCIVIHFMQFNHWAIDSLIYDGNTKLLILIQITKERTHSEHYSDIVRAALP